MGQAGISVVLKTIRFSHTAFALPFAFMGAVLAARGWPSLWQIFWLLMAMVGARTGALALNRFADAELDAENPRTKHWPIPLGLVTRQQVLVMAGLGFGLFLLAAYMLKPFLALLAPPVMAIFILYPYTKRFTWLCHFLNGFCLGMAPAGAWLAITGGLELAPLLMTLAVMFWVAGFDILYSLEDLKFDLEKGLKSFPQRFGIKNSFIAARLCHTAMVLLLISLYFLLELGLPYVLGVAVVTGLLVYEHLFLRGEDPSRVEGAFFTVNGFISIVIFFFTLIDVALSP